MPYDFKNMSDENFRIFSIVLEDLLHKNELSGTSGPLKFVSTPIGITRDEQLAVLTRLNKEHYISFSVDGKSLYLFHNIYKDISFFDLHFEAHLESHNREKPEPKTSSKTNHKKSKVNPIITLIPDSGLLVIGRDNIDIDPKTNIFKVLEFILVKNKTNIYKEFKYSELAKSPAFNDINFSYNKKSWEIYYNACKYINDKIHKEINIPDFLIYDSKNNGKFSINPKVLETLGIDNTKLG
jgi:hypothetical protein